MNFVTNYLYGSKSIDPDHPVTDTSPQQLANMPNDPMVEIFNHLPFIDLSNAALVSKKWHQVSQDPLLKLKLFYQLTKAVLVEFNGTGVITFPKVKHCCVTFKNNLPLEIENISKKANLNSQADFAIIGTTLVSNSELLFVPGVEAKTINQFLKPEEKQFIQKTTQTINQIILKLYQRHESFSYHLKVVGGLGLIHMTPVVSTIYDVVTNLK